MFQTVLRLFISLLILVLAVLSACGIAWWNQPPEKLADSARAGQVILAILILAALAGLARLWAPAQPGGPPRAEDSGPSVT